MRSAIEPGLKIVFVIGALGSLLTGGLSVVIPLTVIALAGIDPAALPGVQQAGAATLGYFVGALLALRAKYWDEVRIIVAASVTFTILSTIGAFYYVVLQGVVSLGLIVILIASLILTVGFLYYLWKAAQRGELM
jgi:hypothetical protein